MNIDEIRLGPTASVGDLSIAAQELADKENEVIRNLLALAATPVTWEDIEGDIPSNILNENVLSETQIRVMFDSALAEHSMETANVHGIADTSKLVRTTDSRLSDSRPPSPHALDGPEHTGPLDAGKLVGDALLDTLVAIQNMSTNSLAIYDDPESPGHPAFAVEAGGGGQFYMGDGFNPPDLVIGRVSSGVYGAALGELYADRLDGETSAWHLNRANHTGQQNVSSLIAGGESGVLTVNGGLPSWGLLEQTNLSTTLLAYLLSLTNATGNLPYARLPNAGGPWNAGGGTVALTGSLEVSGRMALGNTISPSVGLRFNPTGLTGATQFGMSFLPTFGADGTTALHSFAAGGTGANSGSPYTTTDWNIIYSRAPSRGVNQGITNLRGFYADDMSTVVATNRYAMHLVNSLQADYNTTADNTRLLVYDVTAGTLVRVSRGIVDSGGAGFRVLRIPN